MPNEEDPKLTPNETAERPGKDSVRLKWADTLKDEIRWLTVNVASEMQDSAVRAFPDLIYREPPNRVFIGSPSPDVHEEYEKTRQLISDKLAQLPQREDLLNAKEEIIGELSDRIKDLQSRLETTAAELAKSRELEECTTKLCDKICREHEETRQHLDRQLSDLRKYLSKFAPHRRFFRVTFGLLCLFSVSLIIYSTIGIRIIEPFWAVVGVLMSSAMLIVIYFGMKDAQVDERGSSGRSLRG